MSNLTSAAPAPFSTADVGSGTTTMPTTTSNTPVLTMTATPSVAEPATTAAVAVAVTDMTSAVFNSTRLLSPVHISDVSATSTDNHPNKSENFGSQSNIIENENDNGNGNSNCFSLTIMQSSPPPHSYRHSRAYRHFKNPPQPHMCIRTTTEAGEELFINVLSWTRIVIPQEPSDPIPLYGGMRVPPGSPRSPPIVFAVMANPEVLKDSGRHSKDPEERRAMVELMCDFVEAMNPGVKLVRNAVILKDRDISGELKDVWNAVQAQRDREREEQMLQQRQQQHYHNVTTQQMFPKACEAVRPNQQRMERVENTVVTMSSPEKLAGMEYRATVTHTNQHERSQLDNWISTASVEQNNTLTSNIMNATSTNTNVYEKITNSNQCAVEKPNASSIKFVNSPSESKDQIDANSRLNVEEELKSTTAAVKCDINTKPLDAVNIIETCGTATAAISETIKTTATNTTGTIATISPPVSAPNSISTPPPTTTTTTTTTTTRKDKLGGFLPNGCIFPRFKNSRNKEKEKDPKSKDKEKTLLNALKKGKEKKVAPIDQHEKTSEADTNYEKNCINLENEVQKLDLNKIETTAGSEMFIKLKVATTSAAAK